MHKWFTEYMQSELERFLPDPFDDICDMLSRGEPFAFSRFGDGELSAVFGVEGHNCDRNQYFPDLGRRLKEIIQSKPDYFMGLQTRAVMVHGALPIRALAPDISWVLADALHNASMEGRLRELFNSLGEREVFLLGPSHLREFATWCAWQFIEIAPGDCWPQYESLREQLELRAKSNQDLVFLLCASMTANVLVDDLHRLNPRNTYMDAGSVFDPHVGVNSRAYHGELSPDPLSGIAVRE